MATPAHAPTAYQRVQVEGADRRHLVVLLARALVKFLLRARDAIETSDFEAKAAALGRVRAVLSELGCSLDDDADRDMAQHLRALYTHWHTEIVAVDREEDLEKLGYVLTCAQQLADAWQEAYESCQNHEQQQVA